MVLNSFEELASWFKTSNNHEEDGLHNLQSTIKTDVGNEVVVFGRVLYTNKIAFITVDIDGKIERVWRTNLIPGKKLMCGDVIYLKVCHEKDQYGKDQLVEVSMANM